VWEPLSHDLHSTSTLNPELIGRDCSLEPNPASGDVRQVKQMETYAMHATWIYGKQAGKISRMREHFLWINDDPDYYTGSNYVSIGMVQPMVRETDRQTDRHRLRLRVHRHGAADGEGDGPPG
jgi:hypothetical protein